MKTIYMTIMAGALVILASCSGNKNVENQTKETEEQHTEEVELTQTQISTVGITLGKVEKKELGSVIRVNGELKLNPQDKADVMSLIGGIVRKISVIEGQQVKAGQTVAYIENTEIVEMQKNYLVTAREKETAQLEHQRQRMLSAQGAGGEKTLQQAEAAYATAQARLTGLYHQLVQIGISPEQVAAGKIVLQVPVRTTIPGVVGKVSVNTGTYVDTTTPLMQIADNSAVYASLNVFERNISQVEVGQDVDFVITNSPEARVKGKVSLVNRSMNPETKAIAVHAQITGGNADRLIAGMYITGLIHTGKKEVTALPDGAIVSAEGKKFVFVLDGRQADGKEQTLHFKRVEVITGAGELGYTQVDFVNPVDADATVVTGKAFYLASMSADHGEH